jgi:hypothetical protein
MPTRLFLFVFTITAMALGLTVAQPAHAEPVGEALPFSDSGEKMMSAHGRSPADINAEIPSMETVGLPVYPGARYTGAMQAEGMLPTIVMASADPAETVKEWYAGQDGLSYSEMGQTFYAGDEYVMMQSETVFIQDISQDPFATVGGLLFDMEGMKTQISISYQPK